FDRWIASKNSEVCSRPEIRGYFRPSLEKTDSIRWLYSRAAYRLVLASSYRKGVLDRKSKLSKEKANKDGWYS
ncbi:hypothetical protein FLI74_34750, partial [Pseudomonas aeruginosa]